MFINVQFVYNVFVYLPNGLKVVVPHIDCVQLYSNLIIDKVLFALTFGCNLLSVDKLLATNQQCFPLLMNVSSRTEFQAS